MKKNKSEKQKEQSSPMPEKPDAPGNKGNECNDKKCPIHRGLKLRGRTFTEKVVSAKSSRSAIIEMNTQHYIPKYERYEKKRKRLQVHNPDCINAKRGDIVKIQECRPISKTKHFVIIEKVS